MRVLKAYYIFCFYISSYNRYFVLRTNERPFMNLLRVGALIYSYRGHQLSNPEGKSLIQARVKPRFILVFVTKKPRFIIVMVILTIITKFAHTHRIIPSLAC